MSINYGAPGDGHVLVLLCNVYKLRGDTRRPRRVSPMYRAPKLRDRWVQ